MYIDNYIVFAVHGSVFAVVESIRLSIPALLSAVRVGQALRLLLPASWRWIVIIIIVVEWLFSQNLSVQVNLFVQFLHIFLGCFFHSYECFPVLVGLRFYMGGIRIKDSSANQALCYALSEYFVEYLLGNVVIPEPPYAIGANRGMIRPLLCQLQAQKPFERNVFIHGLCQLYF